MFEVPNLSPKNKRKSPTRLWLFGRIFGIFGYLRCQGPPGPKLGMSSHAVSEQKKDLLFEILRELITNVVNHSKANLCIITLFRDEDEWVLQIEDDGVGLDEKLKSVKAPLNKIGLFQIRTQLALKGGHLDMIPASPSGLIARVRIPVSIRDGAKAN